MMQAEPGVELSTQGNVCLPRPKACGSAHGVEAASQRRAKPRLFGVRGCWVGPRSSRPRGLRASGFVTCAVWGEAFIPHQLSAAHLPTCVAFAYALLKTLFANLSGLSEAELVVRRGKAVMRHRAQRGVRCKPKDEE